MEVSVSGDLNLVLKQIKESHLVDLSNANHYKNTRHASYVLKFKRSSAVLER
jgi:hypothetical protein